MFYTEYTVHCTCIYCIIEKKTTPSPPRISEDILLHMIEGEADTLMLKESNPSVREYGAVSVAKEDELDDLGGDLSNIGIVKKIFLASYPISFSLVFEIASTFIALAFASRVHGPVPPYVVFAGVSLANLYANVSCFSILEGVSTALETLGSQRNGAGEHKDVGVIFMRCVCILMLLTLPLLGTWFFVSDFFRLIGVSDAVCCVVANYLKVIDPIE